MCQLKACFFFNFRFKVNILFSFSRSIYRELENVSILRTHINYIQYTYKLERLLTQYYGIPISILHITILNRRILFRNYITLLNSYCWVKIYTQYTAYNFIQSFLASLTHSTSFRIVQQRFVQEYFSSNVSTKVNVDETT